MPVLKYRDPVTGEEKIVGAPSLGGEGGVDIPASDVAPEEGEWWLDTSEDGETHEYAAKDLSNVPNEDLVAKLEESGFSMPEIPKGMQMELLWENARPTSAFAAQTVSVGKYELYMIVQRTAVDNNATTCFLVLPNGAYHSGYAPMYSMFLFRGVMIDDGVVTFGTGEYCNDYHSTYTESNNHAIPVAIYGINEEVSA